ncbi:MAG: hypothetical protein IPP25_06400 [Saprospiraceae bacterium]|nr:hypothetical protein [Candidatus Opimibacter skivensis]
MTISEFFHLPQDKTQGPWVNLSAAFGYNTIANGYSSLSIGVFNDPIEDPEALLYPWTPLFIIGNGDSNTSRSNALTVLKSGKMGQVL